MSIMSVLIYAHINDSKLSNIYIIFSPACWQVSKLLSDYPFVNKVLFNPRWRRPWWSRDRQKLSFTAYCSQVTTRNDAFSYDWDSNVTIRDPELKGWVFLNRRLLNRRLTSSVLFTSGRQTTACSKQANERLINTTTMFQYTGMTGLAVDVWVIVTG